MTETGSATTSYRGALREAHRHLLATDPTVVVMGEDVADYGGTYGVTRDLHIEFGADRVRNTPLSESAFVGMGVGASLGGLRPIVEIMTVNFSLLAMDQIVNSAATLLHMSGGQLNVPVVIRMATGAGRQLAAQHSHSLEGWYAHVPGLRVAAPATVQDAYGMLLAAIEDPDPVLLFEHATLYNTTGPFDPATARIDIDRACVRRRGSDLALIGHGAMVPKMLAAATELETDGIDAAVIDLRTLRPLDTPTILETVAGCRRALVVDEAWRTGSLAAEISARVHEALFEELRAPVGRLGSAEVPIPYAAHLEQAAVPQVVDIVAAATQVVRRG